MPTKRWEPLHSEAESLLVRLAIRDDEVGDAALDATTHLPLRHRAWIVVRNRVAERLRAGGADPDEFLTRIVKWMPSDEWDGDERSLSGVSGRTVRPDPGVEAWSAADLQWMNSTAPGCVLLDDGSRDAAIAALPDLGQRRDELTPWYELPESGSAVPSGRSSSPTDPVTVTAWFR